MTEQNEPSMEDILASIRNILADGESDAADTSGAAVPAAPVDRATADSSIPDVSEKAAPADGLPVFEKRSGEGDSEMPETAASSEQEGGVMELTQEMAVSGDHPPFAQTGGDASDVFSFDPIDSQQNKPAISSVAPSDEEDDDFTPEPVVKTVVEDGEDDVDDNDGLKDMSRLIRRKVRTDDDGLLSIPAVEAATASLNHLTRVFAADRNAAVSAPLVTIEDVVREMLKPLLKEWLDQNLPDVVERVVKKEIARVVDRIDFK